MKLPILVAASTICALAACSTSREQAVSGPAPSEEAARAPITAHWQVDASSKTSAHLVARIERFATLNAPIDVRFEVPKGAVLTPSAESFRIPPGGPVVMLRSFDVRWSEPPEGDLRVIADAHASDFGLHAEDAFRFGRPNPRIPEPARGGQTIEFGGKDLGQPVEVTH